VGGVDVGRGGRERRMEMEKKIKEGRKKRGGKSLSRETKGIRRPFAKNNWLMPWK
jgi:hypothetical protein